MLAGAVQADVVVAECGKAGAELVDDDFRGVAVGTEMAEHHATECGVGDFPDEFGDLVV